jgi:cellulose synthase/poly-beta-1,6-N-acetylglucosamine synthase-like glycosyltransferase
MILFPHNNSVLSFEALFWLQNFSIVRHGSETCNSYLYNLNNMVLYALCYVFNILAFTENYPNMILGDEPLLSQGGSVTLISPIKTTLPHLPFPLLGFETVEP